MPKQKLRSKFRRPARGSTFAYLQRLPANHPDKPLFLNLYVKYFADIVAGKKPTEWRKKSPYWRRRLKNRKWSLILFRNGYGSNRPEMIVECLGIREVSGEFAIRLGRIIEIRR